MTKITRLQELVYEMKVGEVMTREVIEVTPQTRMGSIRKLLRERRISGVPVVQDGKLEGLISIEDLINALAESAMEATVGEKMTRNPVTLRAEEPVVMAINLFTTHGYGRFPVVDEEGRMVGIVTRGDIIEGLLKKLEVEYHEEEIRRYRVSHIFEDVVSDRTSIILRYDVMARDFKRAGEASSNIKLVLSRLGAPLEVVRRAAIAAYEAEMNIIIHTTEGGEIQAEVQPGRLIIRAVDRGPGIPDIARAMQPGFSTAAEWIQELGFGAGMGLSNIQRCANEMKLESPEQKWTRLEATFYLDGGDQKSAPGSKSEGEKTDGF
ncbi:MAG: CBS domain-containing protein [Deltaproteobacteria bacterium]|nr:CBS domain-containing protein [Deltaproteobacteria bacterium]